MAPVQTDRDGRSPESIRPINTEASRSVETRPAGAIWKAKSTSRYAATEPTAIRTPERSPRRNLTRLQPRSTVNRTPWIPSTAPR